MEVVPAEKEAVPAAANLELLYHHQEHGQNYPYQRQYDPQQRPYDPQQGQYDNSPDARPGDGLIRIKRSRMIVTIITVALTAVIVGAAIGGGLGSSLSQCQANLRCVNFMRGFDLLFHIPTAANMPE